MTLLLQLLLAHFTGDFLLQWQRWITDKEKNKWRSVYLYVHCCLHGILVLLATTGWRYWKQAAIIAITHFIIDGIKLQFQKENSRRTWFFLDQALHLIVIFIVWKCTLRPELSLSFLNDPKQLAILTAAVVLLHPSSFFIKNFIARWAPVPFNRESVNLLNNPENDSLEKAGRIIGMIERLLIFIFILLQQWEAIGFLLAAKSIFRFGELTTAKDRRLTEYVLIGTLVSFFIAIIIGLLVLKIIPK